MSFESAYRQIQRRRIREGRLGHHGRASTLHRPWVPFGTEFVSRVVSRLLLRDGFMR